MTIGSPSPVSVGIGLRAPHIDEVIDSCPAIAWLEVHAENYISCGPALRRLERIRENYAISLHGVGLSLGTAEGLDSEHLRRLHALVDLCAPMLVSEHLSWSMSGGVYLNDLLPLPYTEEALAIVARNIDIAQEALGRQILIENPSRYLSFRHSSIAEPEFLAALARRTGCGSLCDVNNVYVTCTNLGLDTAHYLDAIPAETIGEIHLAGHSRVLRDGVAMLIDDHASRVAPPVWELYRRVLARIGAVPTLVEWDKALPPLAVLLGEARAAALTAEQTIHAVAAG
ncbi:MAG TPA: DUF692 domain-containing protein [Stellaceae bacterium]|nr:DUF692 domain-containing protein [Stellaceae bacterium]